MEPEPSAPEEPFINLDDSKKLFSSVSTRELINSTVTLHIASNELVVNVGSWVMNSGLMKNPVSSKVLSEYIIKRTFYPHFCGGKDLREADRTAKRLRDSGLRAMFDYGMEHANDNQSCDNNLEEIIQTIVSNKSLPTSPVSCFSFLKTYF